MLRTLQVCLRRQVWRSVHSAAAGERSWRATAGAARRTVRRSGVRSCTVDPNLEEQFVFLDCPGLEEDPNEEEQVLRQLCISSAPGLGPDTQVSSQKHMRSLERQLQVLKGRVLQNSGPDSFIEFQDMDFPLDESIIKSKKKKKRAEPKGEHRVFGTPDADAPVSDTSCSGCGAVLHCTATDVPGYLPSEKFKVLLEEGKLGEATCQRCHLITYHHKALNLQVTRDQYRDVVRQIRNHKALVLLIADLVDLPDSIIPDLTDLVGTNKHVVVLGNKLDLLPGDSPNYLQRIKRRLAQYCQDAGFGPQVTDLHLISAKTGYGIEALISSLQRSWKYKGDVFLVGSANAGKSTLFNALLESDYCKSRATEVLQKATISPWPGTTLNLLKFPINNPTPYRMFRRRERLKEALQQTEEELPVDELRRLHRLGRRAYLVGRVGQTVRSDGSRSDEIQFDPDSLAFGENKDGDSTKKAPDRSHDELSHTELKDAHWLYDTPGIMKQRDIVHLLQEQEVRLVIPTQAIVPRTFVLKPGMSLFVGAMARIDFLQGPKSCWFTVLASSHVPVHVTSLDRADSIYKRHAGHALLGVPLGGSERMEQFPVLVPQDFSLEGRGYLEAAADITLSSAGWVAVTAAAGKQVQLSVHGPAAAGFGLRMTALLPHIVSLKGERVRKSAAYKPLRPAGLIDGLSAAATQRLQVKKKK
ncbi:nitric oxide-associated protein 1 [Girardinichthys multiradiatus]|uniref:nitric oxide-associated protein 1 n=1 Tax=Girardinichthys multiradiatus TaxID=208333 RepID=UPI001FABAEF4|nr:nitric oxide-associated protein 1 [Girardinichthys multiradiatus]XP_047210250.1 nitric oxide-associated protein 1 [Girardinichthys multiradiatus]